MRRTTTTASGRRTNGSGCDRPPEPAITAPLKPGSSARMGQARFASKPFRVGVYLAPAFSLMSFASLVEPLRAANHISGETLYDWRLYSRTGEAVVSSSGVAVAAQASIAAAEAPDLLLVCASIGGEGFSDRAVFSWLRRLSRRGCRLGAVSTGAFVLARAGLLEGQTCAVHWDSASSLAEQFPSIVVSNDIFVEDGALLTCSGGTATLDMMLHLVATHHGQELANAVSENFIHPHIRPADDRQRMAVGERFGVTHAQLIATLDLMERTTEHPMKVSGLAQAAGVSERQLERLFRRFLRSTPQLHYMELRLSRARKLLLQTDLRAYEIALACGFSSAPHFSRVYRKRFRVSPREERARTGRQADGWSGPPGVRPRPGAALHVRAPERDPRAHGTSRRAPPGPAASQDRRER